MYFSKSKIFQLVQKTWPNDDYLYDDTKIIYLLQMEKPYIFIGRQLFE
jgi:hypothetical protein